jgi:hypothetical protein
LGWGHIRNSGKESLIREGKAIVYRFRNGLFFVCFRNRSHLRNVVFNWVEEQPKIQKNKKKESFYRLQDSLYWLLRKK